jgi:hypothetical protein
VFLESPPKEIAMNHGLEIIPISSYRSRSPDRPPAYPVLVAARTDAGMRVALVAGWMLLIVAIVAHSWVQNVGSIRDLPPAQRTQTYQRALSEAEVDCATPAASGGALHEHCLHQAEFLVLFPECDGHCQQVAKSIFPRARR